MERVRAALLHVRPAADAVVSRMRVAPVLVAALLAGTTLLALAPSASAQSVYCTDPKGTSSSCPGTACVDADRNGRFTYRECADLSIACPHSGCPPPWE